MSCKHEVKEYVGFTEAYNYCTLCGAKEKDFVLEDPVENYKLSPRFFPAHISPMLRMKDLYNMRRLLRKQVGEGEINKSVELDDPFSWDTHFMNGLTITSVDRQTGRITLQLQDLDMLRHLEIGMRVKLDLDEWELNE